MQSTVSKGSRLSEVSFFVKKDPLSVVPVFQKFSFVGVLIVVGNFALDQVLVVDSLFLPVGEVAVALALPSAIFELPLIDLILFYFSAMKMLQTILELPNIFGCVGLHDAVPVGCFQVAFPFPDVLHPISDLLLTDRQVLILPGKVRGEGAVVVLLQSKGVIECEIQKLPVLVLILRHQGI